MTMAELGIEAITIGSRARRNLGDLSTLVESIKSLGLIQPIVVTRANELIAGRRRLEACRQLGRDTVPVLVAEDIDDAVRKLRAEWDENTCRLDMTASELMELGRVIEQQERPKAAEAQAHGETAPGRSKNASDPRNGSVDDRSVRFDVRDRAAEATGLSPAQYGRIRRVWRAANNEALPAEQVTKAREALDLIDRIQTGEKIYSADSNSKGRPLKITTVYDQWAGKTDRQVAEVYPLTRERRRPVQPQEEKIERAVRTLSGLSSSIREIGALDPVIDAEQASQWVADLSAVLRVLRSFHSTLKERANDSPAKQAK